MIDEDRRKAMRDTLDEFDKYMEEMEKHIQDAVKGSLDRLQSHPFVSGFSFKMGPGGKPSVQVFGDKLLDEEGYRAPLNEQILDEKGRTLRVVLDMPGVEKSDIRVDATSDSLVVVAERDQRKYKADLTLKSEIRPGSGKAEYRNGVLEISFSLKDNPNKDFKRVDIV
jgi:HSP20 family protein